MRSCFLRIICCSESNLSDNVSCIVPSIYMTDSMLNRVLLYTPFFHPFGRCFHMTFRDFALMSFVLFHQLLTLLSCLVATSDFPILTMNKHFVQNSFVNQSQNYFSYLKYLVQPCCPFHQLVLCRYSDSLGSWNFRP